MTVAVESRSERRAATKAFGYVVVIFGWAWEREPVFHGRSLIGKKSGRDDDDVLRLRTLCGRVFMAYPPEPNASHIIELPPFHAVSFARPCAHCFPSEADRP